MGHANRRNLIDRETQWEVVVASIPSSKVTCKQKVVAAGTRDEQTRGDGNAGTSSSNARRKRAAVVAPTHPHRLPDHSERGDDTQAHPRRTWIGEVLPSKTAPIPAIVARCTCQPLLPPYMFLLLPAHARFRNVVLHLCVPGSPIFGWIINLRWRVQRGGETTCSFEQVVPPISYPNKRKGGGGYGSCFTAAQQLRRAPGDA